MPTMKIKDHKPHDIAVENRHLRGIKQREAEVGKVQRRM